MGLYDTADEKRSIVTRKEYATLLGEGNNTLESTLRKQKPAKRKHPERSKNKSKTIPFTAALLLGISSISLSTYALVNVRENQALQEYHGELYSELEARVDTFESKLGEVAQTETLHDTIQTLLGNYNFWYQYSNAKIYPKQVQETLDDASYYSRQVLSATLPFMSTIKEAIEKHDMPERTNQILVPAVLLRLESMNGYKYPVSHTGAAGVAQFMPRTAEYFGLDIDEDYEKHFNQAIEQGIFGPQAILYALEGLADETGTNVMTLAQDIDELDERFDTNKAIDAMVQKISEDLRSADNDIYEVLTLYNAGQKYVPNYHRFGHTRLVSDERFVGFPHATRQYLRDFDAFYQSLTSARDAEEVNTLLGQSDRFYEQMHERYDNQQQEMFEDLVMLYEFENRFTDINQFIDEYDTRLKDHATRLDTPTTIDELQSVLASLDETYSEFSSYVNTIYTLD
jgi:hypothetical protein